jgi:hypothetical protein
MEEKIQVHPFEQDSKCGFVDETGKEDIKLPSNHNICLELNETLMTE